MILVRLNPKICQAAENVEQQKINAAEPDFGILDFVGKGVKQNVNNDVHLKRRNKNVREGVLKIAADAFNADVLKRF